MKTVHEVSKISGISVRTLHYYDSIDLLKPTKLTESGYRLYGEAEMRRLQTILMFRELGFKLADIKEILDSPGFDLNAALNQHIKMLKMQRAHIDGLITQAQNMIKGENADFSAFDKSEMENYAKEVKEKWGNTDAYRQSQEKAKNKSPEELKSTADGLSEIFACFGKIKHLPPDSKEAQSNVKKLQDYITANFYNCTKEILAGLGEMYVADGRFCESIDKSGGTGTADFVNKAIKVFTNKR